MSFMKKLFRKENDKTVPPMPAWNEIVEAMFDKELSFTDEIVRVIYSDDKASRIVVLKKNDGLFTYIYERLYRFDEDEWFYNSDHTKIPAYWCEDNDVTGVSVFENIDSLINDLKERSEYKEIFK